MNKYVLFDNLCTKFSCFFCPLQYENSCHDFFQELIPEEQQEIIEDMLEMNNILKKERG